MWTYTLLPEILNMSLTASIVIVLVMLARLLLKKSPKIFSYALWAVVLFRLLCPVSFSSEFSLLGLLNAPPATNGTVDYIPADIVHTEYPEVTLPLPAVSKAINDRLPQGEEQIVADPFEGLVSMATLLWLFGIAVMLITSIVSFIQLRRKLVGAVCLRDNIYLADHIPTPFVIGVFRPKIYLPSATPEQEQSYIILHEQTHIRRLDHIVKMLAFLALCIHWFNPLVWVAFICAVKDMEMSCDERVLKQMGGEIKGAYSTSLLSLASGRRLINGSPLAFGEGNIKVRIRNVMNFRKPAAWVIVVSAMLVAALSIVFATNRPADEAEPDLSLLNYKNLSSLAHQADNLTIALAPGKNEGFYVSAQTIAEYLDKAEWTIKKMNSPPELSPDIIIEWDKNVELRFYKSEPLLAMTHVNEQCRYYNIGKNDYERMLAILGSASIARPDRRPDDGRSSFDKDISDISPVQTPIGSAVPVFNRVKITFVSGTKGGKSADEFETTASKIVDYIYSAIRERQHTEKVVDLDKNYINEYIILLSNDTGGSSYGLYYDTLYNKAYIAGDGGLSETNTDFARYIDSLLENTDISIAIDDTDAAALFNKYGWTLDYQIGAMNSKLNNITVLTGFNPNAYYFAYNNVLSADIGLDMSRYSNSANIDVEIYRINESMPQEFYPIQNCRGIVVRENGKIIGAFISAGRHSAFNACSLKGNSFEKAAGQTLDEWLAEKVQADMTDERLSKLEPEHVIKEYFTALNKKDVQTAKGCISKKTLLGKLTSNMPDDELFNEGYGLPLTDSDFSNLKSARLIESKLINDLDKNTKIFRITVDLQYDKVISIDNGKQPWDCIMVYESPQTGWKIDSFGH